MVFTLRKHDIKTQPTKYSDVFKAESFSNFNFRVMFAFKIVSLLAKKTDLRTKQPGPPYRASTIFVPRRLRFACGQQEKGLSTGHLALPALTSRGKKKKKKRWKYLSPPPLTGFCPGTLSPIPP